MLPDVVYFIAAGVVFNSPALENKRGEKLDGCKNEIGACFCCLSAIVEISGVFCTYVAKGEVGNYHRGYETNTRYCCVAEAESHT